MQVIGLCRFSYPAIGGFQVEHETIEERIAYLYEERRLEERFQLLETVALPCLKAQTDPDFHLVIVIGDQLPAHYVARLEAMIEDLPQAVLHPLPPGNHREVMKDVLNEARIDPARPCLQFRHDDDDAVAVDFIERLRQSASDCAPLLNRHRTVAFDWNNGYVGEFGAHGISGAEVFRPFYVAALGMYVRGNCPLTIMNFAHQKIPRFMPTVSLHDDAMWVRSQNDYNDSQQATGKSVAVKPLSRAQEKLFRERFAIDADQVRQVFSAP
jgi:hypothetical protein